MGAKAHCTSFFNGNVQVRSGEHVWNLVAFTSINGDSCRHQLASLQSDRPTWDSGTRHTEIRTPKCPAYPWTMETEGGICRPLNPDMVRLLWLARSEQIINYCANKSPLTIQSSSDTRPPAIRVPRELPEFLRKPLHLYPTMPYATTLGILAAAWAPADLDVRRGTPIIPPVSQLRVSLLARPGIWWGHPPTWAGWSHWRMTWKITGCSKITIYIRLHNKMSILISKYTDGFRWIYRYTDGLWIPMDYILSVYKYIYI